MNKLVLSNNSTIDDAIRLLDMNGNGILPVVDDEGKLLGIITDGDIRRAILRHTNNLLEVINKSPVTRLKGISTFQAKRIMREIHRRHLPIIDANGFLHEVITLDDIEAITASNWIVIMAGGLGTRLGHLTKNVPKPMLDVSGKPILHRIIDHFKSQGYGRFLLCVNYISEIIQDYFGDGSSFGVEIRYTKEEQRMGTVGALSLIDFPITEPFFVINGDVLTAINYPIFMDYHNQSGSEATMCVKRFSYQIPYACIDFDENNNLTGLQEKPDSEYYINTGIYILEPKCIKLIPRDSFFDMTSLFEKMITEKFNTKVFKIDEYWLDVGSPEDYIRANSENKLDLQ